MGKVTSIITEDMKHCIECGNNQVEVHHVFHGYANRKWSDRFHIVIPLCHSCHMRLHEDIDMDRHYQEIGQIAFMKAYPGRDFKEIFGKNYITIDQLNLFEKEKL